MKNSHSSPLPGLVAFFIAPVASIAATLTFSVPGTVLTGSNVVTTTSIVMPLFNPALGTLTGVQFDINQLDIITFAFENLLFAGVAGSTQSNNVELIDGATILVSSPITTSFSTSVPVFDGVLDFGGTSGTTTAPATLSNANSGTGSPASYIGVGTHTFTVRRTTIANPIAPSSGFVILNNVSESTITTSVTYNYIPVPEPTSSALGLMAGIVALARRRRP